MSQSIKHIYTYDDKLVDYIDYIVGNKAEGQISKQMLEENKPRQIFRKPNVSYPPPPERTCAYQGGVGERNVRFTENLVCFVFF